MTALRTVGVAHPVNFIFMTPDIMKQEGNRCSLRRPRTIGSPIICMRTGNSCTSRMLLDRSLLRSHSPVALSMGEGTAGQIVFSTSDLPDGHGDAAIAPWDVLAVFWTGICATGGSDMTIAVFSTQL